MKTPRDLSREELEAIVLSLQEAFYLDYNEAAVPIWDPDSEVNGGDLVDHVGGLLQRYGLAPAEVVPVAD